MRTEHTRAVADYQRQLEHAHKSAEANIERLRKRHEIEIADLRGKIGIMEKELEKVRRSQIQKVHIFIL